MFHPIDDRWAVGFDAKLVASSLSQGIGEKSWEIVRLVEVRAVLQELGAGSYLVLFARYAVDFVGDLSGRKVGELQIAPTLNIQI